MLEHLKNASSVFERPKSTILHNRISVSWIICTYDEVKLFVFSFAYLLNTIQCSPLKSGQCTENGRHCPYSHFSAIWIPHPIHKYCTNNTTHLWGPFKYTTKLINIAPRCEWLPHLIPGGVGHCGAWDVQVCLGLIDLNLKWNKEIDVFTRMLFVESSWYPYWNIRFYASFSIFKQRICTCHSIAL